jgi:hypothetical protein
MFYFKWFINCDNINFFLKTNNAIINLESNCVILILCDNGIDWS